MTPEIDPHRRFQRQTVLQVGGCGILALLVAVWAWKVPAPIGPVIAQSASTEPATVSTATTTITPDTWNVSLWRPFIDEAPAAVQAAPTTFKLYSILQQGDAFIAAITAGDNAGLSYVKAGDTGNGFSVVRVEANGVVLRINGQEQRLGLGP